MVKPIVWVWEGGEAELIFSACEDSTVSLRIFLQSSTFLFHFLFLPSTQLPHIHFTFHMLTPHSKTMKHNDIGISGLVIHVGL